MFRVKSDSDIGSIASSSQLQPKRLVYYVESPSSRDRHTEEKSLSPQTTPICNSFSPLESPSSYPSSFSRHPLSSQASRVSGALRWWSRRSENFWRQDHVVDVDEEGGDFHGNGEVYSWRRQILIGILGFLLLFGFCCLIIWSDSSPYRAQVSVQRFTVNDFYTAEGSDWTGVPTKLLTVNCSLKLLVHNPATFFGIHVSSTPIGLLYYDLVVAYGQLQKYYQPRNSRRTISVNVEGNKTPLYGAGVVFAVADHTEVPLKLEFVVESQGNVVGNLVRTKHHMHISCSLAINSSNTKAVQFMENSCTYD
ncbi:hypothetical protein Nepgr_015524 [Nepenthes gracilis]|uniref:Late embryogenesis abundant protein LEA-2 subgroup domain-containing protein n=1 Tax=Nepenthes gracilis TaxID=150966 RepID=A0AAD3SLA9_NEPGR|nr:hypothetical protein Nepgr_015524 [Nepenthes gracilis]